MCDHACVSVRGIVVLVCAGGILISNDTTSDQTILFFNTPEPDRKQCINYLIPSSLGQNKSYTNIGPHACMFSYFSLLFVHTQSDKRNIRKSYVGFSQICSYPPDYVDKSRLILNWILVSGNL